MSTWKLITGLCLVTIDSAALRVCYPTLSASIRGAVLTHVPLLTYTDTAPKIGRLLDRHRKIALLWQASAFTYSAICNETEWVRQLLLLVCSREPATPQAPQHWIDLVHVKGRLLLDPELE